jgi:sigma-70-like protein/SnoaL-like protein
MAVSRESIRLAFIAAALQHRVPRQRAVLILRDVLSWRANEVAELLETSEDAVNSTLRRARSALVTANLDAPPTEPTEADRELLYRYIDAFERYDVDSLVALLHEDATLSMPPFELWLQGVLDIRRFLAAMEAEGGRDRVIEVAANRCPALAVYRPVGPMWALEPLAIHVLEIAGGRIAVIHAFLDQALFPVFGLPATPQPGSAYAIARLHPDLAHFCAARLPAAARCPIQGHCSYRPLGSPGARIRPEMELALLVRRTRTSPPGAAPVGASSRDAAWAGRRFPDRRDDFSARPELHWVGARKDNLAEPNDGIPPVRSSEPQRRLL